MLLDPGFTIAPPPVCHPAPHSPGNQQQSGKRIIEGVVPAGKDAVNTGYSAVKDNNPAHHDNAGQYHKITENNRVFLRINPDPRYRKMRTSTSRMAAAKTHSEGFEISRQNPQPKKFSYIFPWNGPKNGQSQFQYSSHIRSRSWCESTPRASAIPTKLRLYS